MNIKYRDTIYSSTDIPLFIFFRTSENRREFINVLSAYKIGTYHKVDCIHSVLAGSHVLKDKRTRFFIHIDSKEEKKVMQKNLFNSEIGESNAILCSPGDIVPQVLFDWVEKNLDKIN